MDYIKSLNDAQKEIATDNTFQHRQHATCIIACAGAGKTKTLIAKIIYMIKELNCDPRDFFITTFTRNAASELKERLLEHLTIEELSLMTIGTFHSIAYSKINNVFDYPVEDNIEGYLYKYCDFINPEIAQDIAIESQDEIYDDDDNLINEERKEIVEMTDDTHHYKYIFIDEYQDVNDIQEKIITALYKHAQLLVVVGDDQQNIYTFRDTKIKYILEFTKNHNNAEYKYLVKNYRCNTNFVTLANAVLSENKNKLDKTIEAMKQDKPKKIMVVSFENQKKQLKHIIKSVMDCDTSSNLHNIAILARNNSVLKTLESTFTAMSIPTFYMESNDSGEKQSIQDISGRLILSTIHGTKGLEFDVVYIIDVNNGIFPSSFCEDIEEERRLFYVGITRSKKKLYICYVEHQPSVFINEIKQHDNCKDILTFKAQNNGDIILKSKYNGTLVEDYSVSNIIGKMNYLDYEDFRNNIFDYHEEIPEIVHLHSEIPEEFGSFCENRNLMISNISAVFNDFLETYILRTIQSVTCSEIENLDYTIYALHCFKNGIEDIKARKHDDTLEQNFGINIKDKSDEYIEQLVLYYQSGIKINSYINKEFVEYFVKAYKNYKSDRASSSIVFDIFIISLIKGIIRGRNSILHLINFENGFDNNKINKSDLLVYRDWFEELELSYSGYFDGTEHINTAFAIFDKQSKIKGILDLQHDDTIFKIKSNNGLKPQADTLIQTLAYSSLARVNNKVINKCSIYNPLTGYIHTWNLSEWTSENDVIYFMTDRYT